MTARTVTLLALAASLGIHAAGCTNGTTPVCDDGGSCLILSGGGEGGASSSSGGNPEGGGSPDAGND